jgi:hypothetical protein
VALKTCHRVFCNIFHHSPQAAQFDARMLLQSGSRSSAGTQPGASACSGYHMLQHVRCWFKPLQTCQLVSETKRLFKPVDNSNTKHGCSRLNTTNNKSCPEACHSGQLESLYRWHMTI